MSCPPILFLIFNRPDLVEVTFETIRKRKPGVLFISGDGPRDGHSTDEALCEAARAIANRVDWDCDLQTLFQQKNLGCRSAVTAGISWFFDHVDEGIILEEDCLADPSFFNFCHELLGRYRETPRVKAICGESYGSPAFWQSVPQDYVFAANSLPWGWATWADRWKQHVELLAEVGRSGLGRDWYSEFFRDSELGEFWDMRFKLLEGGKVDSWAWSWFLSMWRLDGLAIHPNVNMISNRGFDARGTHTTVSHSDIANRIFSTINFPLKHPDAVERCFEYEQVLKLYRYELGRTKPPRITGVRSFLRYLVGGLRR